MPKENLGISLNRAFLGWLCIVLDTRRDTPNRRVILERRSYLVFSERLAEFRQALEALNVREDIVFAQPWFRSRFLAHHQEHMCNVFMFSAL